MKKRRSKNDLEQAVERARTKRNKALAYYDLGLFHDNNSREIEAVPYYENALQWGLKGELKAQCLAWLASSLYKTGNPKKAMNALQRSRKITKDAHLERFLKRLEGRIQITL